MKIGYNKIWGVMFFMLDGMLCCLTAFFVRSGEDVPVYFAGMFWVTALFGILFLTRTYVDVTQTQVSIKPPIGFGTKTYRVQSARDFSIEGREVFVVSDGVRQKLPVSRWLVDLDRWASLLKWIQSSTQQTG